MNANKIKNGVGRPKKAKLGRPKVEKLYLCGDGKKFDYAHVYSKEDINVAIDLGEIGNGDVVTEVVIKDRFKVVAKQTYLKRI